MYCYYYFFQRYQARSICNACTLKSDQQNPAGLTDSQERLGCSKQNGNLYIRTLCAPQSKHDASFSSWTWFVEHTPQTKSTDKTIVWLDFNPIALLFRPPIGHSLLSHGACVGCYHPIRLKTVFWRACFRLHPLNPMSPPSLRARQRNT